MCVREDEARELRSLRLGDLSRTVGHAAKARIVGAAVNIISAWQGSTRTLQDTETDVWLVLE